MTTGNNPYSTGIAPAPINQQFDTAAQMKQFEREDQESKAPRITPVELDSSEELLTKMYSDLLDFKRSIEAAQKNTRLNRNTLATILGIVDNIGKEILIDIPAEVDKLMI
jgi:hypothetical protein